MCVHPYATSQPMPCYGHLHYRIFILIAMATVCILWFIIESQIGQGSKLKQDTTQDHSSMVQDRRRAGGERDSRRRFFRYDFCIGLCRFFPTSITSGRGTAWLACFMNTTPRALRHRSGMRIGLLSCVIFQHLHAVTHDEQRGMKQLACLQNVCRYWDFTEDHKRATIDRWYDYARDVRFYSHAVECSSSKCTVEPSVTCPSRGHILQTDAPLERPTDRII